MKYHIVADGKAAGPYTVDQLMELGINEKTLVWFQGLPNWVAASTIPEIDAALKGVIIPPVEPDEIAVVTVEDAPAGEADAPAGNEGPDVMAVTEPVDASEVPVKPAAEPVVEPAAEPVRPVSEPVRPYIRPVQAPVQPTRPDNHLVMAIIGLVLFFPLGIPALVKACFVNYRWNEGQYEVAQALSQSSRKFATWAIVIGAILNSLVMCSPIIDAL